MRHFFPCNYPALWLLRQTSTVEIHSLCAVHACTAPGRESMLTGMHMQDGDKLCVGKSGEQG